MVSLCRRKYTKHAGTIKIIAENESKACGSGDYGVPSREGGRAEGVRKVPEREGEKGLGLQFGAWRTDWKGVAARSVKSILSTQGVKFGTARGYWRKIAAGR
jgi:hypothetical protein